MPRFWRRHLRLTLLCAGLVLLAGNIMLYLRRGEKVEDKSPQNETSAKPNISENVSTSDPLSSPSKTTIGLLDSQCRCKFVVPHKLVAADGDNANTLSTCSDTATARGPGQRVVSYSLFDFSRMKRAGPPIDVAVVFFKGIEENLFQMRTLLPGFVMRVYHNYDMNSSATSMTRLCKIFCSNEDLDLCDAARAGFLGDMSPSFGMIWRFAPMADPLVQEMHSRDLDSKISRREVAAMNDWRNNTEALFHGMRDHPLHNSFLLGGLFGLRRPKQGLEKHLSEMKKALTRMLVGAAGKHNWIKAKDQIMLAVHLWPHFRQNGVIHDSYRCHLFAQQRVKTRPFPTRRDEKGGLNHVGSSGTNITRRRYGVCPRQCRPKEHQDWDLC